MIDVDTDTHGSVYDYDRKVPLIFWGNNIKSGTDKKEAHIMDVSPTLAHLAGIPVPKNVDGKPLITEN